MNITLFKKLFTYLGVAIVGLTLLFASTATALIDMRATGMSGCDTSLTTCTPNKVQQGQILVVRATGVPMDSLDAVRVAFNFDVDNGLGNAPYDYKTDPVTGETSFFVKVQAGASEMSVGTHKIALIGQGIPSTVVGSLSIVAATTPGGSTTPTTPSATNTPQTPVTPVQSDLECASQGLEKDAATGLCLPKNPYASASPDSLVKATSVGDLIKKILNILLTLGGVVAVLFIVLGGYEYITSRGSEERAKSGRKTMTYAIIGLVAILLAFMMVTVMTNLFTQGKLFS